MWIDRPKNVRLYAALFPILLLAQQPTAPPITTSVPLVLVPVTVTDAKGNFIDGLTSDDFVLSDEGVAQKIQLDTSDTVVAPVAIVVLIQSSGISTPALAKIRKVGSMIEPLLAGERGQAAVITYDEEIRVVQDFTSDGGKIKSVFQGIIPRTIKSATLFDAIVRGVRMLDSRSEHFRRVMVILGESRDRGSKYKLDPAIEAAQRENVAIYHVTYSAQATAWTAKPADNPPLPGGMDILGAIGEVGRLGTKNAADALALATGGRHLSFARYDGLESALQRVSAEIHSQYLLSFVPRESENRKLHKISVTVPSRKDAVIRARSGFWPQ